MPQEISLPKPSPLNHWNAVRSKSVPSGVSGSHAVATQKPSHRTDTSILNQDDGAYLGSHPSRIDIEPADFPVVRQ